MLGRWLLIQLFGRWLDFHCNSANSISIYIHLWHYDLYLEHQILIYLEHQILINKIIGVECYYKAVNIEARERWDGKQYGCDERVPLQLNKGLKVKVSTVQFSGETRSGVSWWRNRALSKPSNVLSSYLRWQKLQKLWYKSIIMADYLHKTGSRYPIYDSNDNCNWLHVHKTQRGCDLDATNTLSNGREILCHSDLSVKAKNTP